MSINTSLWIYLIELQTLNYPFMADANYCESSNFLHKNAAPKLSGLKSLCGGFSNSNCGDAFRMKLAFEMTVQYKTLFTSVLL